MRREPGAVDGNRSPLFRHCPGRMTKVEYRYPPFCQPAVAAPVGRAPPAKVWRAVRGDPLSPAAMENTHLDPTRPTKPSADGGELHCLGSYRLLRKLGEGGMGAVYLGYHEGEARQVAIKVLNDSLTINQAFVDRFYREAKSGALLNHPNIVRSLAVGQDKATGKHYLVLEFVDGPSALDLL